MVWWELYYKTWPVHLTALCFSDLILPFPFCVIVLGGVMESLSCRVLKCRARAQSMLQWLDHYIVTHRWDRAHFCGTSSACHWLIISIWIKSGALDNCIIKSFLFIFNQVLLVLLRMAWVTTCNLLVPRQWEANWRCSHSDGINAFLQPSWGDIFMRIYSLMSFYFMRSPLVFVFGDFKPICCGPLQSNHLFREQVVIFWAQRVDFLPA